MKVSEDLVVLSLAAASIGFGHTLLGPDHYLPFVVMGRARSWSLSRTLGVTLICGIGHVLGSIVLGSVGILLGWSVLGLEVFEGARGGLAAWALIAFGLLYGAWGLRRALRKRPHEHWHQHADGTVHCHAHVHRGAHVHVHDAAPASAAGEPHRNAATQQLTPWALFVIFVLGPCEPLIPILMYPAATESWSSVAVVTAIFAAATLTTMLAVTAGAYAGLSRVRLGWLERYSHALAGLVIVACGLVIRLGS